MIVKNRWVENLLDIIIIKEYKSVLEIGIRVDVFYLGESEVCLIEIWWGWVRLR